MLHAYVYFRIMSNCGKQWETDKENLMKRQVSLKERGQNFGFCFHIELILHPFTPLLVIGKSFSFYAQLPGTMYLKSL